MLLETMTGDLAQLWGVAVQQFDTVKPGLMDSILDGSVKTEERFVPFVRIKTHTTIQPNCVHCYGLPVTTVTCRPLQAPLTKLIGNYYDVMKSSN